MQAMRADRALENENEWIQAISRDGYHGPLAARLFVRPTTGLFLLTVGKHPDWIDIYARARKGKELVSEASGEVCRYGWNLKNKYWAYGIAPSGSREIKN